MSSVTYFTPLDTEKELKYLAAIKEFGKTDVTRIKKIASQLACGIVQADPQGAVSFDKKKYNTGVTDTRTTSEIDKTKAELERAEKARDKAKKNKEAKEAKKPAGEKKKSEGKTSTKKDNTKQPLGFPVKFSDSALHTIRCFMVRLLREQKVKLEQEKDYSAQEVSSVVTPFTTILTEFAHGFDEKSPLMERFINQNHFAKLHTELYSMLISEHNPDKAFNLLMCAVRRILFEAAMDAVANYKTSTPLSEEEKKEKKARADANKSKDPAAKEAEKKAAAAAKKAAAEAKKAAGDVPKKVCMNTTHLPRATVTIDSLLICKYLQRSGVYSLIQSPPATSKLVKLYKNANVLVAEMVGKYIATITKQKEAEKKQNDEKKAAQKANKGASDESSAAKAKASVSSAAPAPKQAVNSVEVASKLVTNDELPDL
jgi:hypothetical protein